MSDENVDDDVVGDCVCVCVLIRFQKRKCAKGDDIYIYLVNIDHADYIYIYI